MNRKHAGRMSLASYGLPLLAFAVLTALAVVTFRDMARKDTLRDKVVGVAAYMGNGTTLYG
jgi:hypothetical protein